ncbi:hypothetical protein HQO27_06020 [Rhodococcus fascians]|nr:hypothetical protein [Rhodococcus fascians]MBY4430320.1 hypothetical protein [Rhodococcus fascians]
MTIAQRPAIAILADDLSGAAESAALFLDRDVSLRIDIGSIDDGTDTDVCVVDLGTRVMSPDEAAARVRESIALLPSHVTVVKKIDSMLRGHIAAEVESLLATGPVVFAAGLPALGRTVENGVPHIDGVPLHLSGRWAMEPTEAPSSITELFGRVPTVAVASDAGPESLRAAVDSGAVAVFDVRSDADLDAIVAVSANIPGVRLVGTSALAAAVARTLDPRYRDAAAVNQDSVLVVVGTAESVAMQQVSELVDAGATHVAVHVDELPQTHAYADKVRSALSDGTVVLSLAGPVDASRSADISQALAGTVAEAVRGLSVSLVLTGGETARRVLDGLGVTALRPVAEIHHGAVVSRTPAGEYVATRPGSFGGPDSLVAMAAYLHGTARTLSSSHSEALT